MSLKSQQTLTLTLRKTKHVATGVHNLLCDKAAAVVEPLGKTCLALDMVFEHDLEKE